MIFDLFRDTDPDYVYRDGDIRTTVARVDELREDLQQVYDTCDGVISHQFENGIGDGVKGFLFSGPPGVGKTELAKLLAKENGYELFFIDGKEVARAKYGHSEDRLKKVFERTKKSGRDGHVIVLFDDIESLIISRDAQLSQEWHYALNSLFFHEVDELDTSKAVVICTTNRDDLVDAAIRDRFYEIEVPIPSKGDLEEIAEYLCSESRFHIPDATEVDDIKREIATSDDYETVRDVENLVLSRYVEYTAAETSA